VRADFFLHHNALVRYLISGDSERGYKAKADMTFRKSWPAQYVPICLEKIYPSEEEAEGAIIDFCKRFIEENKITVTEEE
jgi:hypothetical protein